MEVLFLAILKHNTSDHWDLEGADHEGEYHLIFFNPSNNCHLNKNLTWVKYNWKLWFMAQSHKHLIVTNFLGKIKLLQRGQG